MKDVEVQSMAEHYSSIVIFGYGDIGKHLYYILKEKKEEAVLAYCDNICAKQGKYGEYEVFSVEDAVEKFQNALFLITSKAHKENMENQLLGLNVHKDNIQFGVTEEAEDYVYRQRRKGKYAPMKLLQFEVDIVSHCNLNCKCCSQFSSIAGEEYIEPKDMEKDFRRLGELFHNEAGRIYLIGGEPLLHPDIIECMRIARRHFTKGQISVFTNGILLLQCSREFWLTCSDLGIDIIVTKYPVRIDYEAIKKKALEYHIGFDFFGTSQDFKYMTNLGLDIEGRQQIEDSFTHCIEANNCVKLKKGRLYTCTRPAAIYKFNQFFHTDLQESEEDSIDIYKAGTGKEILEFLAKPIPFCRYCNVHGKKTAMEWGKSEGKIAEWL